LQIGHDAHLATDHLGALAKHLAGRKDDCKQIQKKERGGPVT